MEFQHFEVLAEAVRGWDLDWRQLDRGGLEARVIQVGTPEVLLSRAAFNRAFLQGGASPPGMVTFGLLDPGTEVEWCGQTADDRDLLVFGPGQDYESLSLPGFLVNTVSISVDCLERSAAAEEVFPGKAARYPAGTVLRPDPEGIRQVRSEITALLLRLDHGGRIPIEAHLGERLPRALVRLAEGASQTESPGKSRRRGLALRGCALLDEHAREAPSIAEVSRALGASLRSLNYAFRDTLHTTPKAYLQAARLDGVRRELVGSVPSTVSDAANRWGFWHMGQFARDYRRQFGELPSETVARRARAAGRR